MKSGWTTCLMALMALMALMTLLALAACDSENLRGDLEGTITNAREGGPLEGVLVSSLALKGARVVTDLTDGEGYYRIRDATYGLNEVTFTRDGFYDTVRLADIEKDRAIQMDLRMIRILDVHALTVTVWVEDDQGAPIPGARVVLYRRNKSEYGGTGRADTFLRMTETDAGGKAVFLEATNITEDKIMLLRIDAAAPGYRNATIEVAASFEAPLVRSTLQLDPLP